MAQISAALVAEHSTCHGAGEAAPATCSASHSHHGIKTHGHARPPSSEVHASEHKGAGTRLFFYRISQDEEWRGTHMSVKTIDELLLDELKDIYSAEKQITKALPKMARAAVSQELKSAFETHLQETQGQIERLDQIFETLGKSPRGKTCQGMQGLIEEGSEMMGELDKGPVRDAGLISAAQRVEHYEMAAYGSVREFATLLGHKEVASLLEETLEEEKATDEKLTGVAKKINPQALKANKAA
jgi:ferritin-like metal-binding protein YciE